jgi:hypothetical protein
MRQWWVYINGEQSVYSDNGDWSDSSVATKFGRGFTNSVYDLLGDMDDIRYYDYCFSHEEMQVLSETTSTTLTYSLRIGNLWNNHYDFDGLIRHMMIFDQALSASGLREIHNATRLIPDKAESYVDPIVNGTYDDLTGWTVVNGGSTTVTVDNGNGYINYQLDCTPNYLYQDITIPNASSVILEFDYTLWFDDFGAGFSILINDTSVWYKGRSASGTSESIGWTTVQVDISEYAGQTVRLKAPYHYDTSSTYCSAYNHHAWIRMDNIKLIME